MDLLFRTTDGHPVIGEVKIADDKNAMFALLQALTYAVELSTPNQLERLYQHYPNKFSCPSGTPCVHVAVILVNPVKDQTREPVVEIVRQLNDRRKCASLGNVSLYVNSGEKWMVHS